VSTKAPERTRARSAKDKREKREKPPIDPRIRARRIEVQRTEGRRRLQRLGWLAIACAAVVALWWLSRSPLFDVDSIRVQGAQHTGAATIAGVIGIERGDALLTADVGGAAHAVSELPWVATAKVRRSWPGTISVTVVERVPVAAIAAKGGGWVVVDVDGRTLAKEKQPAVELMRIAGRPMGVRLGVRADARYRGAIDLAAAVPPSLRAAVASIWPQRDGSLEATIALPGGATATARFGAANQLEAKLVALAAVLERADLARVRIIDLRVPGAPALTRA
jgi:cell division protein FtsQ